MHVHEALCHGENGHKVLLSGCRTEMSDRDKVVLGADSRLISWSSGALGGPGVDLCILNTM